MGKNLILAPFVTLNILSILQFVLKNKTSMTVQIHKVTDII